MNPLLQDPGLAFHPPMLYAGYVGFAVPFAFAIAALLEGRVDASWGRWVRPWTLASWCLLTCGISLGSWWAYYELGWGGFWFWDPVENASLLPWLTGTALLHSAIVVEKREALKVWTVLLAIATFSLSLSGTFLVRSGILNSVHAFANDPARGVFILGLLGLVIGSSLLLFALRAPSLTAGGVFAPLSREGALVLNNVLLCSIAAVVITGTMYPLFSDLILHDKLSVGAPFFNATVLPLAVPVFVAMAIGPVMPWKRAALAPALMRIWWAACHRRRGWAGVSDETARAARPGVRGRRLDDRRGCRRYRRAHPALPPACPGQPGPSAWPADRRVWRCAGACGHGRHGGGDCRHVPGPATSGAGASGRARPRRGHGLGARLADRWHRVQLHLAHRQHPGNSARQGRSGDASFPPQLHHPEGDHHRGRDPHHRVRRYLRGVGRGAGWRRGHAAALQPAGARDLAGRPGDGDWRRVVAGGPAPSRWRTSPQGRGPVGVSA